MDEEVVRYNKLITKLVQYAGELWGKEGEITIEFRNANNQVTANIKHASKDRI